MGSGKYTLLVNKAKNHEYLLSFLLIFLVVMISNLHAVFGLDRLLQDDNAKYFFFQNNDFTVITKRFLGLRRLLKWFFVTIFSTYSAQPARLVMLTVFMIPLSFLFYYFNRKFLRLSVWVSLASAIIINIIPKQFLIPTFLDGSYPVPGMLVFLATIIFANLYLNTSRFKYILFTATSISWLVVNDLISEMGIFLLPAFLYYIYSSAAIHNRKKHLYIVISLLAALRLFYHFQTSGLIQNRNPVWLTLHEIADRIITSISWWLPFNSSKPVALATGILVGIVLIYAFTKSLKLSGKYIGISRAYIFFGLWAVATGAPFWLMSPYVASRHFYIAYIALTTLTLMAAYQLFILPRRHRQIIATVSLLSVLSLYGAQRYLLNADNFSQWNKSGNTTRTMLQKESLNADSQIALVNINHLTNGYYLWSSGYLQYLLKIPGITGVIGKEMNFYDPFNLNHCGYRHRMSCLDPGKELIAFKRGAINNPSRMIYFLRWIDAGKRDSKWIIYRSNSDNKLSIIGTGSGLEAYKGTLSALGLDPEQVLWGNSNERSSVDNLL